MNLTEALQAALAGEHAALYGYGVIGGRLADPAGRARARSAYDTHQARRAALRTMVAAVGAEPISALPAYDLGGPVLTTAQAKAFAARLELAIAGAYADLVAASPAAARALPAAWLADAAVRAAGWSGAATAFPGISERS